MNKIFNTQSVSGCVSAPETVAVPSLCSTAVESPVEAGAGKARRLGGWLILGAIFLGISPLHRLQAVYTSLNLLWNSRYQSILAAMPGLTWRLLFEAATDTLLLVALIGLNVLFYTRRKEFPASMIAYLASAFVWVLIDNLFVHQFTPAAAAAVIGISLLPAVFWIPYCLRSQRVKATFVN